MIRYVLGVILCGAILAAGDWVMFSDGKDTYIYSTTTGEIYIRHNMGKKNYEDVFVRMPRGAQPSELGAQNRSTQSQASQSAQSTQVPQVPNVDSERMREMQLNALKKSQDMLNAAID